MQRVKEKQMRGSQHNTVQLGTARDRYCCSPMHGAHRNLSAATDYVTRSTFEFSMRARALPCRVCLQTAFWGGQVPFVRFGRRGMLLQTRFVPRHCVFTSPSLHWS